MDEVILSRIRQEAYKQGYQDGKVDGYNLAGTQMSSAKQERKKGHWINRSLNICYPEWERYTCSECGKHAYGYDFCPNCGADMRGEQDGS